MKKEFIIVLCGLILISTGLRGQLPKVVASASIFEDMASHLGKELIETASVVPIGGDPHVYEPTPSDAVLVANADLILINGLTFEGWINELAENSGTNGRLILITEGIKPIASEQYKGASDPHAWMDAKNGIIYAQNISKALQEIDPENKEKYQQYLSDYIDQLKELDRYIEQEITSIPEQQRVLITSHDAFAYYGKRYGIKLSAIMGISTDAEAQTSDIIRVTETIKKSGVPAIFIESTINPKLLQQIAKDNNVKIGGELFADSIGDKDSEGHGYIEMLRYNTDVIVGALARNELSNTKLDQDSDSSNWLLYSILALFMIGSLVYLILKFR
jgi:ABC-type Zn uptake system ZnuABC Zn-binding protein ZnuA